MTEAESFGQALIRESIRGVMRDVAELQYSHIIVDAQGAMIDVHCQGCHASAKIGRGALSLISIWAIDHVPCLHRMDRHPAAHPAL